MAQEANTNRGKNTKIFTRDKWHGQFAMWPNVKKFPNYHMTKSRRTYWGSVHAGLIGLSFETKVIFPLALDL